MTDHITPTELARRAGVSKQAVFDRLADSSLPVVMHGAKKMIDPEDSAIIEYIRDGSYQRDTVRATLPSSTHKAEWDHLNGIAPSDKQERTMAKSNKPSKLSGKKQLKTFDTSHHGDPDNTRSGGTSYNAGSDPESAYSAKQRKAVADAKKAELQADHMERRLIETKFVRDVLFRHIDKLNSGIERTAGILTDDFGHKIVDDIKTGGKVSNKTKQEIINIFLCLCDDAKKAIIRDIDNYEPVK